MSSAQSKVPAKKMKSAEVISKQQSVLSTSTSSVICKTSPSTSKKINETPDPVHNTQHNQDNQAFMDNQCYQIDVLDDFIIPGQQMQAPVHQQEDIKPMTTFKLPQPPGKWILVRNAPERHPNSLSKIINHAHDSQSPYVLDKTSHEVDPLLIEDAKPVAQSEPEPEHNPSEADSSGEYDNAVEVILEEVEYGQDLQQLQKSDGRSSDIKDTIPNGCQNCEVLVKMLEKQQRDLSGLQKAVANQGVMLARIWNYFLPDEKLSTHSIPFKFPLKEDGDLHKLEEYLATDENQDKLKQWILQTKGASEIKQFLPNLIHSDLQSLYNVRGVRGKQKLADFERILECLFECFKKDGYGYPHYIADVDKALRNGKMKFNKKAMKQKKIK